MRKKTFFLLVGVLGVALFVYFFREQFLDSLEVLKAAKWPYLLLILPIQALSYFAHAMFYRRILLSIDGPGLPVGRLYGLALGVTFTNTILPSGGASGISLMAASLKNDKVSSGQAAFVHLARVAIIYVSFIFLLLFALATLYFGDDIARIAIRIVILIIGSIVGMALVAGWLIYDKRGFDWLVRTAQRFIDWVTRRFRKGRDLIGPERVERVLKEFHDGVRALIKSHAYVRQPLLWGLLGNVLEVATLYMVFLALGAVINPGIVIIAYAVANGVGALSLIPGDVGIFEVAMVTILSLVGVPLAVSVSATVTYRVITKAIMLPIGFYFYNQNIKEALNAADD